MDRTHRMWRLLVLLRWKVDPLGRRLAVTRCHDRNIRSGKAMEGGFVVSKETQSWMVAAQQHINGGCQRVGDKEWHDTTVANSSGLPRDRLR